MGLRQGSGNSSGNRHAAPDDSCSSLAGSEETASAAEHDIFEEGPVCRICFDANPISALISPCCCKGSQQYVHVHCLRKWQACVLDQGKKYGDHMVEKAFRCSVCLSRFSLAPLLPMRGPACLLASVWGKALLALTACLLVVVPGAGLPLAVSAAYCHMLLMAVLLLLCSRSAQPTLAVVVVLLLGSMGALYSRGVRLLLRAPSSTPSPDAPIAHAGSAGGHSTWRLALVRSGQPVLEDLHPGTLLVASHSLLGSPLFSQSVVLLLNYSATQGAQGLLLTHPLEAANYSCSPNSPAHEACEGHGQLGSEAREAGPTGGATVREPTARAASMQAATAAAAAAEPLPSPSAAAAAAATKAPAAAAAAGVSSAAPRLLVRQYLGGPVGLPQQLPLPVNMQELLAAATEGEQRACTQQEDGCGKAAVPAAAPSGGGGTRAVGRHGWTARPAAPGPRRTPEQVYVLHNVPGVVGAAPVLTAPPPLAALQQSQGRPDGSATAAPAGNSSSSSSSSMLEPAQRSNAIQQQQQQQVQCAAEDGAACGALTQHESSTATTDAVSTPAATAAAVKAACEQPGEGLDVLAEAPNTETPAVGQLLLGGSVLQVLQQAAKLVAGQVPAVRPHLTGCGAAGGEGSASSGNCRGAGNTASDLAGSAKEAGGGSGSSQPDATPTPDDLVVLLFSGCAGWAAGQLEDEIQRGAWAVVDGTLQDLQLATSNPQSLWSHLMHSRRLRWP